MSAITATVVMIATTSVMATAAPSLDVAAELVGSRTTSGLLTLSGGDRVDDLTTARSSTYIQADGSYRSVIATTPVNYLDRSGQWQPIDNTLVSSPGVAYAVENAANDYTVRIPTDASASPVRFVTNDGWLTFQLQGADGMPAVAASEATFTNVPAADSLTYQATGAGLKEEITLAGPPAAQPSYTFRLGMVDGLTPAVTQQGAVVFSDTSGSAVFAIPKGFMTDSATGTPAYSGDVGYTLREDAAGWKLTVTPDISWLHDPNRVYPVIIDPTVTVTRASTDCWITSDRPNATFCGGDRIRVGVDPTGNLRRSLVAFDVSHIPSTAVVTNADLALYLDGAQTTRVAFADYRLRQPSHAFTSVATWNTANGVDPWVGGSPVLDAFDSISLNGSTSGYKHWIATDMVSGWVSGAEPLPNRGFLLKQSESTATAVSFYSSNDPDDTKWPRLIVDYTNEDIWDTDTEGIPDEEIDPDGLSGTDPVPGGGEFGITSDGWSGQSLSSTSTLPSAGWAACGVFDSRYKVVRDYQRRVAHSRMAGRTARLYCGMENNRYDSSGNKLESAFGYWHIKQAHSEEWQAYANRVGRNWRDLAGWAIYHTLEDPGKVQNQSPIRFCFNKKFYYYNQDGQITDTFYTRVYLGETGVRIMTAFISENPCRGDNILY
jgi:hypothetical protein